MSDYLIYAALGVAIIAGVLSLASIAASLAAILYQNKRRQVRSQEELSAFSVMLEQNQRYFQSQMDSMSTLNFLLSELKKPIEVDAD